MITIFPIEDRAALEETKKRLDPCADVIFEAKEGEKVLGRIAFAVYDDALRITALEDFDPSIVDGLIKSAMSYARQREIPRISANPLPGYENAFTAVGFKKIGSLFSLCLDTFTNKCPC